MVNQPNNIRVLSLRKKKHDLSEKQKISYINIGSESKPTWSMINENNKKQIEFVRTPFDRSSLPKIDKITRKKYFQNSKERYGIDLKRTEEYSDLKLEGKNLLNEEIKMIRGMKGKKFLIKKDEEIIEGEKCEYYNTCNTIFSKRGFSTESSYVNTSIK